MQPIGPAPVTRTSSPTRSKESAVWTALPSGSKQERTSSGIDGSACQAVDCGMATSSLSTLGTGTSSSQSPGSARLFTTACIVFCTRKKLGEAGKKEKLDSSLVGRGDGTARDGICVLQQIRLRSRA